MNRALLTLSHPLSALAAMLIFFSVCDVQAAGEEIRKISDTDTPNEHFGLYSKGLGLEMPMVGLGMSSADQSSFSVGYLLGLALFYEVTPAFSIRAGGLGGRIFNTDGEVSYLQGSVRRSLSQPADYWDVAFLAGADYQKEMGNSQLWLYGGGDLGYAFAGHIFRFDPELADIEASEDIDVFGNPCSPEEPSCGAQGNTAMGWSPSVDLRGGVRMRLTDWLISQFELALFAMILDEERVTNTLDSRVVRRSAQIAWVVRSAFSLRLGL
ncbi:hypothetical protein KAI87_03840 [Myxococcota bacterium]|nr:hypothetical protein [Myxococcota bacterium]